MFCMNCGTKLPDGAKFCMKCGAKVGSIDAAPVPAPAPKTRAAEKNVEMQAIGNTSGLYVPNVGIYALGLHGDLVLFNPANGERTELIPPSNNDEYIGRFNLCYWEGNVFFIEIVGDDKKLYVCKVGTNGGAVSKTEVKSDGTVSVKSNRGFDLELTAYWAPLWNGALWFIYETGRYESQYFVCSISLSTGRLSGKRLPEAANELVGNNDKLFIQDGYGCFGTENGGIRFKLNDPSKFQLLDAGALHLPGVGFTVSFYKNKLYSTTRFGDHIYVTAMEKDWVGATRRVEKPKFANYDDWIRLGSHLVNPGAVFDLDTEEFTRPPEAHREGPFEGFRGDVLQGFQEMPDGSAYYFNGSADNGLKIFYLPADAWKTGEYETVVEDSLSLR